MYENSKGKEDSCRVEFRYENMPKHKLGTNPNTWKDKDSLWLLLSVAKGKSNTLIKFYFVRYPTMRTNMPSANGLFYLNTTDTGAQLVSYQYKGGLLLIII